MKRYILNITTLITALILSANFAWGENALPTSGNLESKTYTLSNDQTQTGTITVKNGANAIINLNGYILNGNGKQIFDIKQGGSLTINGSGTITNGSATDGGCAYISGTANINNVTITNCSATNDGGVFYVNVNGTLTIQNGEFSNNSAVRLGGAICKAGTSNTLTISGNTKFRHNWAKNSGGAIYARTLQITGNSLNDPVVIEYNKATALDGGDPTFSKNDKGNWTNNNQGQGGGIFIPTSSNASEPFNEMKCNIKYCNIQYNYAAVNGGGIYSGINSTIELSKIQYNNAMSSEKRGYKVAENDGRGGGFYFAGYYRSKDDKNGELERKSNFTLKNTYVTNNAAMYYGGGGQLTTRAILTVEDSYINENTAVLHGAGGLHLTSDVTLNFTSGEINNNYAYTVGGGIHTSYGCTLNLNGGIISGNKAHQRGGGVHVNTGGNLVLNRTNITSNEVYKGKDMAYANVIKNLDGTFTWDPNSLDYNRVSESSYKYENNDDTKYLTDTGYGGGVLIDSGTCTINTGELSSNYAEVAGGGLALVMIRLSDSVSDFERLNVVGLTINNGVIESNTTDGNGAGVYIMRNKILEMLQEKIDAGIDIEQIENSSKYKTLTEGKPSTVIYTGSLLTNIATQSGGAIYMEEGNFSVNGNITMNENQAGANGGALYLGGGSVNMAESTISGNSSKDGGAIYVNGGNLTTTGTTSVTNNYANEGSGGAFYVTGGIVKLYNATITGNGKQNSTVKTVSGGAVYVTGSGGGFELTGSNTALIQNNASTTNGGAIYVGSGSVTLQKATISGNNSGNGGAIYAKGNVTINDEATINSNTVTGNGGAIYVEGGSLTTKKVTASGNSAANGGVFFVKGGNVNLGVTVSGSTVTQVAAAEMTSNTASGNGGAIALENGVFRMHNDSKINSNRADGYGGGLYIKNASATEITCKGGTFSHNQAKAGGAVCADGPITLALAANIENNTAQVGGGIYMVNGVNMTFGDKDQPLGLIRANKAEGTTAQKTASGMNADKVSGVGGGIFMADGKDSNNKTMLTFANPNKLGIYNNSASFAGADICANGKNTSITLPQTSVMNLTGFDVPGNMLYWAEDFANGDTGYKELTGLDGIRYEDELRSANPDVKHFDSEKIHKVDTYACLDLGYDLVFFTLRNIGLKYNDDCAITFTYDKKNANGEGTTPTIYRKILFTGKANDANFDTTIGLPSGDWTISETKWSYKYDATVFDPGNKQTSGKYRITKGYIYYGDSFNSTGKPQDYNEGNNASTDKTITVTHRLKTNETNISDFSTRVVNKMIPGGSSSN